MEAGSKRFFLRAIVILALLTSVVVVVVCGYRRSPDIRPPIAAQPSQAAPGSVFDAAPTILVIGDSFAAGVADQTVTYPELVADMLHFRLEKDAIGGRGFFVHERDGKPIPAFGESLDFDITNYRPRYVIVDGGRNDLDKPADSVVQAMNAYLTKLRAGYQDATIIVVVPVFVKEEQDNDYRLVANGTRRITADIGGYVIDPLAEGWYTDVDMTPLLWHDGVLPNDLGSKYYAQRIVDDLHQWGINVSDDSTKETR